MDNRIPDDSNRRVERIVETRPTTFHMHQDGDTAGEQAKKPRIEVPDEESRRIVEALLGMTPRAIANILLNREDRRRGFVHFLPREMQQAIALELPNAAEQREIERLQALGQGLDNVILAVARTAIDIELRVRKIVGRRLAQETEGGDKRPPGQREWWA